VVQPPPCLDHQNMPTTCSICRIVAPLFDTLGHTFLKCYSLRQELSVDDEMVNGTGEVCMPKKPVKWLFKVWCCSFDCCGYLCTFQVYQGKPTDPITGKKTTEKGLIMRVVSELVALFAGLSHVVYCVPCR